GGNRIIYEVQYILMRAEMDQHTISSLSCIRSFVCLLFCGIYRSNGKTNGKTTELFHSFS
ncbi:MAG TPA: hypothetical protein O0X40_03495, partial [Methanocorpusculum sp.]|nr:hypothetical protein [Methanocorpusculum sp.]